MHFKGICIRIMNYIFLRNDLQVGLFRPLVACMQQVEVLIVIRLLNNAWVHKGTALILQHLHGNVHVVVNVHGSIGAAQHSSPHFQQRSYSASQLPLDLMPVSQPGYSQILLYDLAIFRISMTAWITEGYKNLSEVPPIWCTISAISLPFQI